MAVFVTEDVGDVIEVGDVVGDVADVADVVSLDAEHSC